MTEDIAKLKQYAEALGKEVQLVADEVLDNPKFVVWWGGLRSQHHNFDGGLAKHTREVVELCFSTMATLGLTKVDKAEIFLAALFHDIGKTYDYTPAGDGTYTDTEHKRMIHHISRSAIVWSHAALKSKEVNEKYHDLVLHAILSHHGERAWGSPVAPKTRTAWILHLCDNLSARINDCDRVDLVREKMKS